MFYLAYLGVTVPMLVKRLRGEWPKPDHGPYFSLGRWGLPVNIAAVIYGALVALNIAWPRNAIYNALGTPHWYWQWSPLLFIGGVVIIGSIYYFTVQVQRSRRGARRAPSRRARARAPSRRWARWRHDRRRRVRLCDRRWRDRGLRGRGSPDRGPVGNRVPDRGRPLGRRRSADSAARGLDVPARLRLRLGLPGRAPGAR